MDRQKDLHGPQETLITAEKRLLRVGKSTAGFLASIAALRGAAEAHQSATGATVGAEKLPEIEKMAAQLAELQVALGDKISDLHASAQHAAMDVGARFASGGDKESMGELLRRMFGG